MTQPTEQSSREQEREAFEAHCMRNGGNRPINWDEAHTLQEVPDALKGKYIINSVQQAWEAWQAARALSAAQPVAQEAPIASTPYEPTENMRWAAKQIDPALPMETIRAIWSAMWSAAPKPSQEAVAEIEMEPDYMSRGHFFEGTRKQLRPIDIQELPVGTKLYATPHPPVSAEAGKGVEPACWIDRAELENMKQYPDCEPTVSRKSVGDSDVALYTRPSESVAVNGEVSDSQINEVIRRIYGVEGTPRWATLREFARAVLALAGSAKQSAALERMARLDDEMGIEP